MTQRTAKSSNLAFVAALVSYGATVESVDRTDIRRVVFEIDIRPINKVFVLREGVPEKETIFTYDDLLNMFVSDILMLMPNYMTKVTDLKSLIYERKTI